MIRTVDIGPYKLFADDGYMTHRKILENGLNYEPHIIAELRKFIPSSQGFLDLGANVGLHSLVAASINPDLPIYSIEMAHLNIQCLLHTVHENNLSNIHVIHAAVADKIRVIKKNVDPSNTACSIEFKTENECPEYEAAISVDDLNLPHIDLIKIDIEGFEYLALQGMKQRIAGNFRIPGRVRPRIIFEFCPEVVWRSGVSPEQLLQFFLDNRYKLTCLEYEPGARKECNSANHVIEHLAVTSKWITDILAEPEEL